ncbi:uncharacterized protein LOC124253969 [Haliotis rubra]|uniref:uncharacterized protein LOC124253969 n=1 Tax=Haliotis rubra TaxID=36100 RepID=UPI001EE57D7A|nr:uncharacterized protein LOC124253969 [Haliotis rubra]XP_046543778.1 uncharacterized protein LOC124253969 [Haliotis rubra]
MPRFKKKTVGLIAVAVLCIVMGLQHFNDSDMLQDAASSLRRHSGDINVMVQQPLIRDFSSLIQNRSLLKINRQTSHESVKEGGLLNRMSMRGLDLPGELPPRSFDDLGQHVVPNTVFYVWCGNRTFEYIHYLSVRSVWTHMEPDVLEIHYKIPPRQDKYNDWLDELKSSIANLGLKQMPGWVGCENSHDFGRDLLHDTGGILVSEDTVILNPLPNFRKEHLSVYLADNNIPKVLISSAGNDKLNGLPCFKGSQFYKPSPLDNSAMKSCQRILHISDSELSQPSLCVYIVQQSYPKHIISLDSPLAADLRYVAYGQREPVFPSTDTSSTIPKNVHYVWYNKANMTFIMYLSIMSSLYVLKADKVFIHGNNALEGFYWDKVKVIPRVRLVFREIPREIFGKQVLFRHHKSDILRGDILYKYGGIYVDWDALWLRPVDDIISAGYDVVVDIDHLPREPYPDSINMGVVLSKPRSKFIDIWRKTYRKYRNDDFYYNPIEVPYKIYERHPNLVKIEPRLQVMCFRLQCHPIFHPQYKDFQHSQPFNWRTDAYAIHFTYPDPEEYENTTTLNNASGMFAEIGKHILDSIKD